MNTIFFHKSVFSLSLATIALLSNGLSASAQTVEETSNKLFTPSVSQVSPQQVNTELETFRPSFSNPSSEESNLSVNEVTYNTFNQVTQNLAPVPGTTATSSAALNAQYPPSHTQHPKEDLQPSISSNLAQADIDFGGFTRGGSSYIGVAGNLGLDGESALGDGNFMVISKVGLTDILSLRPSAVLGDDAVILLPLTYDFSLETSDPFREALPFSPYVGAGLAYETGDNSELSFLLSGGVDVPLTRNLTATAAINAAFFDETDLGLSIGVGYNFGAF